MAGVHRRFVVFVFLSRFGFFCKVQDHLVPPCAWRVQEMSIHPTLVNSGIWIWLLGRLVACQHANMPFWWQVQSTPELLLRRINCYRGLMRHVCVRFIKHSCYKHCIFAVGAQIKKIFIVLSSLGFCHTHYPFCQKFAKASDVACETTHFGSRDSGQFDIAIILVLKSP